MSVLTPESGAVPAGTGGAFAYRRLPVVVWFGRGRGFRLALSLAAGLLGALISGWNGTARFVPLPLDPFVSATAALLFGGWGILGSACGQLAAVWVLHGGFLAALAHAAPCALLAVSVWLVFRYVPGLGRGFPNLRSYVWLLAGTTLGCAAGGLLQGAASLSPSPWTLVLSAWTWTAGGLLSVGLLAPPLLLAMDRFGRRFMAPLPGEMLGRRAPGADFTAETLGEETLILPAPPARLDIHRPLLVGAGWVLGVTVLALVLTRWFPSGGGWIAILYLAPILWAALGHGMRAGLLASSASGLTYLLGMAWIVSPEAGPVLWEPRGDLLLLSLGAAFVGRSREREVRLCEDLADTNRLLRRDLLRVAQALTQAVEAKDAYTEGHLRRVSQYAVSVGEKLGLRGQDLETLHYASMLHDVGKLGVPEQVLRKEGPLDAAESAIMRRHPEIGARILEKLDLLHEAAPLVLHHQERFDGVLDGTHPGYPGGLAGNEIPLGARIIAVVDAFDAMTTDRPYRAAFPVNRAADILLQEKGRQFDPRVVDAFLSCLVERPWRVS